MPALTALAGRTRAAQCIDCGKCTPLCPVSEFVPGFSPRRVIEETLFEDGSTLLAQCLACAACENRCHAAVQFSSFVRDARASVRLNGGTSRAHGGLFAAAATTPSLVDRTGWLTPDLRVAEKGEVLVFVGCAPLYDRYFGHLGVKTLEAVRGMIRILNASGIEPVLMRDEVCCGHDSLWSGDLETFRHLAHQNLDRIKASGAELVLTACAECTRCLGVDYPQIMGDQRFRTQHITQWMAERTLPVGEVQGKFTFQDPCRLSRHLGEVEAPRKVLGQVPGLELVEMTRSGREAMCCGTEGFSRCSSVSKNIQRSRLAEAAATGAETLLVACPKCQVHLSCAGNDPDVSQKIEVRDIVEVIAEAMKENAR